MTDTRIPDRLPILTRGLGNAAAGTACAMSGCERPVRARGLCNACRQRVVLPRLTDADRFWPKVDVRGPDECWEWKAFRYSTGYGAATFQGKQTNASRVALLLSGVTFALGEQACHHCDNPPCVNPVHLYVGTAKTNSDDITRRGRHNKKRGAESPRARLTVEQIAEARNRIAFGESKRALAAEFGVHESTVGRAVRGVTSHPYTASEAFNATA